MTIVCPLDDYPAFRASDRDALATVVENTLGASLVQLPAGSAAIDARANCYNLPNSALWFCSYGLPIALKFPDNDYVRIQLKHAGAGATWIGDKMVAVTETEACVSSGAVEIDFGADFQQFVWRIPKRTLVQKLSVLTGGPVSCEPQFDPVVDLRKPESTLMVQMMGCILDAASTVKGEPARIVLGELEQALIAAFLSASDHDFRGRLERKIPGVAPWQVHRAESYIEGNWDKPITIEDLASVTGTSARSLFRTFKQSRGYSPLEFARRIRLDRARDMLNAGTTSVTEVAFACGFGDLSRFSRDFSKAFGERPSAVVNRRKSVH